MRTPLQQPLELLLVVSGDSRQECMACPLRGPEWTIMARGYDRHASFQGKVQRLLQGVCSSNVGTVVECCKVAFTPHDRDLLLRLINSDDHPRDFISRIKHRVARYDPRELAPVRL